ncbi:MAG TPA: YfhO family protein [Acidimicrobiales bacterium]|nr:YfhO family protein [Acidimicrobiales bacterium]
MTGTARRAGGAASEEGGPHWLRRGLPDILGIAAVAAAAVVVLAPALAHGASLGPFDLLSRYGLTRRSGVRVHNAQTVDQIAEMVPWTVLSWTQVHAGHLPLWNPDNGLGLPLAFNWQSAAFSLPTLLGYLAPLHLAYTVAVLATFVLGGTGAYVFARVLRLHPLACVLAGVAYELSGEFVGFSGWPIAGVMAWTGWLFAAAVLVVRGRHRVRAVSGLALATAGAFYAGQPDALVVVVAGLALFLVVVLAVTARRARAARPVLRPLLDLVLGAGAGGALAAPLVLPGLQLVSGSVFAHATRTNGALSPYDVVNLLFQGFNGRPVAANQWFGVGSTAYVGVVAVVLACAGVGLRRRRPEVMALAAVVVVMGALAFVPALASALDALPFHARWHLGMVVVTFALAVLAGVGADVVLRHPRHFDTRMWLGSGFAVAAVIEAGLWLVGRGHLPPASARLRDQSFAWPVVATAVGLVVVAALRPRGGGPDGPLVDGPPSATVRAGVGALAVLVAVEAAFLLGVGTPVWSSSPGFLPTTTGVRALQAAVGGSTVAFGTRSCELPPTLGILPEANAAYGVHELSAYDPITPRAYFRTLRPPPSLPVSAFCPVVRSAAEARRYGVGFILEPAGARPPAGTVPDGSVGTEALYRVPGAAAATATPLGPSGALPRPGAAGTPLAVTHPGPASWRVETTGTRPAVVRLRLTDVPGWHATVDGRPLALRPFGGIMLQAVVPGGRHTVVLTYDPGGFRLGLALGAVALAALLVAAVLARRRGASALPQVSGRP